MFDFSQGGGGNDFGSSSNNFEFEGIEVRKRFSTTISEVIGMDNSFRAPPPVVPTTSIPTTTTSNLTLMKESSSPPPSSKLITPTPSLEKNIHKEEIQQYPTNSMDFFMRTNSSHADLFSGPPIVNNNNDNFTNSSSTSFIASPTNNKAKRNSISKFSENTIKIEDANTEDVVLPTTTTVVEDLKEKVISAPTKVISAPSSPISTSSPRSSDVTYPSFFDDAPMDYSAGDTAGFFGPNPTESSFSQPSPPVVYKSTSVPSPTPSPKYTIPLKPSPPRYNNNNNNISPSRNFSSSEFSYSSNEINSNMFAQPAFDGGACSEDGGMFSSSSSYSHPPHQFSTNSTMMPPPPQMNNNNNNKSNNITPGSNNISFFNPSSSDQTSDFNTIGSNFPAPKPLNTPKSVIGFSGFADDSSRYVTFPF